jgi:hypothetical protein
VNIQAGDTTREFLLYGTPDTPPTPETPALFTLQSVMPDNVLTQEGYVQTQALTLRFNASVDHLNLTVADIGLSPESVVDGKEDLNCSGEECTLTVSGATLGDVSVSVHPKSAEVVEGSASAMVFGPVYVSESNGSDDSPATRGTEGAPFATVKKAADKVTGFYKDHASDWPENPNSTPSTPAPADIVLLDDITESDISLARESGWAKPLLPVNLISAPGKTFALELETLNNFLITVGAGVELTLKDVTFQGLDNNTRPLVLVKENGELIMGTATLITGNTNGGNSDENNAGGGVMVSGGVFTMKAGAAIRDNTSKKTGGENLGGGGVGVVNNGEFIMEGGTISGNVVQDTGTDEGHLGGGGRGESARASALKKR